MPLSDVRVLDLSRLLPGPFCTLLLADLGADVVKVEDLEQGDYLRHWPPLDGDQGVMFQALNRNKRSLALDLKNERGREIFLRLATSTDVIVETFRPGVMERLGIGYATLRERNPGVILCSISGYGADGPYRDRAGHDLNYQGLAGVLDPEAPHLPRVQLGDLGGGAFPATVAILAALHERSHTGQGRHCDIAMLDGLLSWQLPAASRVFAGDGPNGEDDILDGSRPCYGVYPCSDGYLTVAALEPKFWSAFLTVIELPRLMESAFATGDAAASARKEIEAVLRRRSRSEWMAAFEGHDVCVEPVNDVAEALRHPQAVARGMVVPGPQGGAQQVATPLGRGDPSARAAGPAPRQGEHSRQILREAGYDDAEITMLIDEGVTR